MLHSATILGADQPTLVPVDDDGFDPRPLLPGLVGDGVLDTTSAGWLGGWLDRLGEYRPPQPTLVLIHGDIAPRNVLVAPDGRALAALVDWGDAALADPAMDFAKLPIATLPGVIDGYLDRVGADERRSWLARALWYQVAWAVAALARTDVDPERVRDRLAVVLRHLTTNSDSTWTGLGPPTHLLM